MKKKLAVLIYSLAAGGAERVVSLLLPILQNKYDVTLVLMHDTIEYELPNTINTVYLENSSPSEYAFLKFLKLPRLAWKYTQFCKQNKIDLSLSFMNRPNYINSLSKLMGNQIKILISERIAPSQEYATSSLKDKISRYLIQILYPHADSIIPNSNGIADDLIKNFKIAQDKITVIHNPINIDQIATLRNELCTLDFSTFTFISVARFQPQKNHRLLLDAFSKLSDINIRLLIIGDGELKTDIEKQVQMLNLNSRVTLLGKQENPFKYLSHADCFILTSDYEGFPNAILEALACGLPVISTDCQSGPQEILAPDTDMNTPTQNSIKPAQYGLLTPVNNADKLADAMRYIYQNNQTADQYRKTAKIRANDFNLQKISRQFIKILEN